MERERARKTQFFVLSVTLENDAICLSRCICIASDQVRENFSAGAFQSESIQRIPRVPRHFPS